MNEGYQQRQYPFRTKRYCQTMELKDDAELIRKYCLAHDEQHFRPEIMAGMREVGILEMEVYIAGNRLVMIVEAPENFRWDDAMAKLALLPGQQEWEEYVAQFQNCSAEATSDEKWQMMTRIFHIYDNC